MNYIEQIKNYQPFNEQEAKDKEIALYYANIFNNILDRECEIAHITSSSWIVNKERTKVLMVYHNIYKSWSWTGGHADSDGDLLSVAIREAKEETGLKHIIPLSNDIFSIENLCVDGHFKRGKYVTSHLHINVTYLLEADELEELKIKDDENSAVKWFTIDESLKAPTEIWMINNIYRKLNEKMMNIIKK